MCSSKWSMHFLLECMCFTGKGMCSSAMSNAPNGTAWYCSADISAALHIHSLMAVETPIRQDSTYQALSLLCGDGVKAGKREGSCAMPACGACIRGVKSRGGCGRQTGPWQHTQGVSPLGMQQGMQPEFCLHTVLKRSAVLSGHPAKSRVIYFAFQAHPMQKPHHCSQTHPMHPHNCSTAPLLEFPPHVPWHHQCLLETAPASTWGL